MRATLEFDLPEESEEHLSAIHGNSIRCLIQSYREMMFQQLDKGDMEELERAVLQKWFDCLNEEISAAGLSDEIL